MHTLKNITVLLRADLQAGINGFRHGGGSWRRAALKGVGYLVFIAALSVLGHSIFTYLRLRDADPIVLLRVINGFMIFGVLVVAKELMEAGLKTLYEAPDTALLHAAPIRPVAIFGYKFLHLTFSRVLSSLCFLGPPWVVFGFIYELPWHFYLALFPVCLSLLVMIAGYATLSVMTIARFFSSRWLLTALKGAGAVIGLAVGFLISLTFFFEAEFIPMRQVLLEWVSSGTAETSPWWYPHEWFGKFLLSWVDDSTSGLRLRWMLGGVAGGVVGAGGAVLIAHLIYQRGWENIRTLNLPRKSARRVKGTQPSLLSRLGRGKIRSLMLKDFLTFIRHSGRLISIVMLTLFLVVYICISLLRGEGADESIELVVLIGLYSLLNTFGISCNGLRDEAKTWWLLRAAPISPSLVFGSKFLAGFLCALIYAEFWGVFAVGVLRASGETLVLVTLMPLLTLPVACAMNTAIGTLPWMAELNPPAQPVLRVLTLTLTLFINAVLVALPVFVWQGGQLLMFAGLLALLAIGFTVAYRYGIRNLRKLLVAEP